MKYVIDDINVLDGSYQMELKQHQYILIEDNLIKQISNQPINEICKHINGKDLYITPGLINLHVHLPANGKLSKKNKDKTKLVQFIKNNSIGQKIGLLLIKNNAKQALLGGVTTERAVGGVGNLDSKLRDLINCGKAIGPRLIVSNEAICTPKGHMEGTVSVAVNSTEEAVKAVEQRKNEGVDIIKIMITGGVLDCKEIGHPGDLKMSEEMVKAICEKAHSLNLKVAAHVEGPEGMHIAIQNGVDTIEHGYILDTKYIDEFIARNGVLVATLSPALPIAFLDSASLGLPSAAQINSNAFCKGSIELINYMKDHQGLIGLGTDVGCPLVTHYDAWREMNYFSTYINDVDLNYALHTMTETNAQILGLEDKIGLVKEGMLADLVLLKENPLENINAFANPYLVIKNGIIYRKKVKKNKSIENIISNIKLKSIE